LPFAALAAPTLTDVAGNLLRRRDEERGRNPELSDQQEP
jgi:hypothetical protein